jgi:hypothetical protein
MVSPAMPDSVRRDMGLTYTDLEDVMLGSRLTSTSWYGVHGDPGGLGQYRPALVIAPIREEGEVKPANAIGTDCPQRISEFGSGPDFLEAGPGKHTD